MGNGASSSQGSLPSRDTRDVRSSVREEQHDWQAEQAVAPKPETHSLQQTQKSYSGANAGSRREKNQALQEPTHDSRQSLQITGTGNRR